MFHGPRAEELQDRYPTLARFAEPLVSASREIVGRDTEMMRIMAAMLRPEVSNLILLAPPGAGKTALVQGVQHKDVKREYFEIDLAKMRSSIRDSEEMAGVIKNLFDDAERYPQNEGHEIVLFIDEFHQIVQLSEVAVEALKPVLAQSGARGLRIIAATTNEEFERFIQPNLPLVERLQRIDLEPPSKKVTMDILQGMAQTYDVPPSASNKHLFEQIYELTNRYQPASHQPRKSLLMLDSMVGWHRLTGRPMNMQLLADVFSDSLGVNIAFKVDAPKLKAGLDAKVFAQKAATTVIANRLQICVAGLNDPTRPQSSFLFQGSSGVGKACTNSTPIPVFSTDGSVVMKTHGTIEVGDMVFNADGVPCEVLGVFPQPLRDIYRVTLSDGRHLDVTDEHLWEVCTTKMRALKREGRGFKPRVMTTRELLDAGVTNPSSRSHGIDQMRWFIPMNKAASWAKQDLPVDPYALGALIGNGCLTNKVLTISSNDLEVVQYVSDVLGATAPKKCSDLNYDWVFGTGESWGKGERRLQTSSVLVGAASGLVGVKSSSRRIPEQYLRGSVPQRWALLQGLFDTDGTIDASSGRFNISYSTSSLGLAEDVRELLFSLGISSSLNSHSRMRDDSDGNPSEFVEYDVHVKVGNQDKARFFCMSRKRSIALRAAVETGDRQRVKTFDMVGIRSIEKLEHQELSTCIYIADDRHLYQAGQFVVTHNTEVVKQLSTLLFGDAQRHLIRFDMSEFSQANSVDRFREMFAARIRATPFSVVLLDEIEKAAPNVVKVLLQVLDDGRITDTQGRQVSCLNAYIVLTTNAGTKVYDTIAYYDPDDEGSGEGLDKYMKLIYRAIREAGDNSQFPPELLGRLDAVVPFQPLSDMTLEKIVRSKLRDMRNQVLSQHDVKLTIDEKVLYYLIGDKSNVDPSAGGARAAIRLMNEQVLAKVAAFINANPHERAIRADVVGELVSENKSVLLTDAHVEVTPHR